MPKRVVRRKANLDGRATVGDATPKVRRALETIYRDAAPYFKAGMAIATHYDNEGLPARCVVVAEGLLTVDDIVNAVNALRAKYGVPPLVAR